jgi:hypothetical protein
MNGLLVWIDVVNALIQGTIFHYFYRNMLGCRRPYKETLPAFLFFCLLSLVMVYVTQSIPVYGQVLKTLCTSFFLILASMLLFKSSFKDTILHAYLPFLGLVAVSEILALSVTGALFGIDVNAGMEADDPGVIALIYIMTDAVEGALLILTVRILRREIPYQLPMKIMIPTVLVLLFQTILFMALGHRILFANLMILFNRPVIFGAFVLSSIGFAVIITLSRRQEQLQKKRIALAVSAARLDEQVVYLKSREEEILDLRKDMMEALKTIDEDAGKQDLAARYRSYRSDPFADDVILDVLLRSYADRFTQAGVQYEFAVHCPMKGVFSEMDTVKVFSNLLDNAFAAVQDNPEGKRSIRLEISRSLNICRITETNDLPIRTRSIRKKVHGEGLNILNGIMQARGGSLESGGKDGRHETALTFTLPQKEVSHEQA